MVNEKIIEMLERGVSRKVIRETLNVTKGKIIYIVRMNDITIPSPNMITCQNCSKEFTPHARQVHKVKFCSNKCRSKFNKANGNIEQSCKGCGESFHRYEIRDFCSSKCRAKQSAINRANTTYVYPSYYIPVAKQQCECTKCGCKFEGRLGTCLCIGCRRPVSAVHTIKCRECSKQYTTTRSRSVYCSIACSNKYTWRAKEVRRRRRIIENGEVHHDISIDRLMKRDKRVCHICNDIVSKTKDTNHNEYPSVDHLIPIAKGGTHTWDNVKLAHRICNAIKSDSIIEVNE